MVRIEVLGGLRVECGEERLARVEARPKRAALLAYLAVEREASREKLCSLLWPESEPAKARHALSQTLLELKRELGPSWVEADGERLAATDELQTDVAALQAAMEEASIERVVSLYRGALLQDVRLDGGVELDHWIDRRRAELYRKVRSAIQAAFESERDPRAHVHLAERWLALDPLDDEAHHALILSLASSGDRAGAIRSYEKYARLIRTELEVEPLEHTRRLVDSLKGPTPFTTHGPSTRTPVLERPTPPAPGEEHGQGLFGPDFVVLRLLSSGATGSVHLAREPAVRRLVAIKVLRQELCPDPIVLRRFEREAQSAARVRHPHVAPILRVGTAADGRPYLVMPYIKGTTLADRIAADGPVGPSEARRILGEVASALAAVHAVGVIHRDVRPANVLCEGATGQICLADFGIAGMLESGDEEIARLTRTGELLGNVAYVSPEQLDGRPLDGRSDVFALGVMGFELLTGSPVRVPDEKALADVGERRLVDILRRAVAPEPSRRPSAADVAEALQRERDAPRWEGVLPRIRRKRLLPIVAAYLAAGLAGMGGVDQLVQQGLLSSAAYLLALSFFVAGLGAALIVGWFHGERGSQSVSRTEIVLLSGVVVGWLVASIVILR